MDGLIGGKQVNVLRDSGCNGVLVKWQFVKKNEYTGKYGTMTLADKSIRKFPIAKVYIESRFFSGKITALCLDDAMYDVIIGNIPNDWEPSDTDLSFNCNNIANNVEVNERSASSEEEDLFSSLCKK